jgi:tRNA-splicing ligase RtcB
MIAVRTSLKRDDIRDPAAIRHGIERSVPMSAGRHNKALTPTAATR